MRAARIATAAALLVLALAGTAPAVNMGDQAMPFEGEVLEGGRVDLKDYLGKKAILIKFGSIYCSTCVSSLEDVARVQRKFKPADLQIVGVNLDVYGIPRVKRF